MTNSNLMKNLFLLTCLMMMFACQKAETGASTINEKTADWAMESNFKLDFRDKSGQIEEVKGRNEDLMASILDAVESGNMPAYDYETAEKLTAKQIKDIFSPIDTIILYDDNGFESGEKAVENKLNRPAVKKFRVKQDWFWEEETKSLQTKVKGLAPLETIYNEDGETVRGDLPLFWVFF